MKKLKLIPIALLSLIFTLSGMACAVDASPTSSSSSTQTDSSTQSSNEALDSSSSVSSDSSSDSSSSSSNPNENSSSSNTPTENEKPPVTTPSKPQKTYVKYIRCTGSGVNLRSGAGTSHTIIGSADKGTVYALSEKVDGWYKTYYRGKTAYISASYGAVFSLEKTENSKINKVLEEGYKLIGVPYVYGAVRLHDGNGNLLKGFTAQKFDCSSLVQYVFYKGAGVKLNTTTRTQIKQGKYVHPDNLQPGDCLFFTNEDRQYKTGIERVGHVAIYLGNNYILHTASDYARIEQISQKRWGFYIEARRFI